MASFDWMVLLDALDPDIALLQETSRFDDEIESACIAEATVKKNLRNSIYVKKYEFERLRMLKEMSKALISVRVSDTPIGPIFFLGVYGNLDYAGVLDITLLGFISMWVTILRNQHDAKNILISGDFNMDRRMDDNPTGTKFSRVGERRHNTIFDGILNLGFSDCMRKFHSEPVQTFRAVRGDYPWELDHMFATKELYKSLESIEVISDQKVVSLSDHNPICANFSL